MRADSVNVKGILVALVGLATVPAALVQAAPITFANAILADSPVAYWRFNEAPGAATAVDASGNGNNATYSGTVMLGQPGVGGGDTAALFNAGGAVDGRAVAANNASLNPANISIEALVDWQGDDGFQQRIVEKSRFTGGQLPEYGLNILPDGQVRFEIQVGATNTTMDSIGAIHAGIGTDVAATYDGALMRIYIGGVLDSVMAPILAGGLPFDLTDLGIGNQVDRDRPFNGTIDELALFGYALSGDQLAAHAAAAAVPEPATMAMVSIGILGLRMRRRR